MEQVNRKQHILLIYIALAAGTFAAFEPALHNDFVGYDDPYYVTDNPNVNVGLTRKSIAYALTAAHGAIWNPVTTLSHMLDCQLFGLNPFWHHLTSLLFHVASTLLLFGILKRMTGSLWPSAFVAAAFALHPLRLESVAWVSSRKDVLSVFFWMLTMWAYIRYTEHAGIRRYLLVFLFLWLGLLAKPMLLTLPFALLLLDYWPLRRFQPPIKKTTLRLIAEKLPLFALVGVVGLIAYIVPQSQGALKLTQSLSLSTRFANALVGYIAYIGKIFYPADLVVLYPHPRDTLPAFQPIASLLLLALISAAVFYKTSNRRYLRMGWLWYLGTLLPVIGLVQLGHQAIADRYTYLPSIGIFIIVAWGAAELLTKSRLPKAVPAISAAAILIALSVSTRVQARYWQNSLTLYERAVTVTKNNHIMHYNYANALLRAGRFDDALTNFKQALKINPQYFDARNGIGRALLKQGKTDDAIAYFSEMLRLKPGYYKAHYNIALAMTEKGDYDNAIEHFHKALRVKPDWPDAYYNMGRAFYLQGDRDAAAKQFIRALRLKPDYLTARVKLAQTLTEMGETPYAVDHYRKALELRPNNIEILTGLAWLLAASEDTKVHAPPAAVKLAQKACELTNYEHIRALDTLAVAYAAAGKLPQAIETAKKALQLAITAGKKDLVREIDKRLRLYSDGQPCRSLKPDYATDEDTIDPDTPGTR
ncbi:MAG: tetratricopeptide repeat protein [Planctomycetota bacterium]|nr:MAG: tetratricopeptide repeat protein [Planctomycetota bacterium]